MSRLAHPAGQESPRLSRRIDVSSVKVPPPVRRAAKPLKPVSARLLTVYYITALLIVAGFLIASHIALAYVLHDNAGSAQIINSSGRQRMLSQRIASLAAQVRLGDASARPALLAAINAFEVAENRLSASARAGHGGDADAQALRALYSSGPASLDTQCRGYLGDARLVAALPVNTPQSSAALTRLLAAARAPLLDALNQAVTIHERQSERKLYRVELLQWDSLAVVLLTLTIEALMIFRRMIRLITAYTAELVRLVSTDPLTELANRRGFLEAYALERARATRHHRPLSLMMLDADHFKKINDTHGHGGGDEVLKTLAETLRRTVRVSDVVGRIGGEEFVILLPETELEGAVRLAERLRAQVAGLSVKFADAAIRVTVSIGVTSVPQEEAEVERILNFVDELMYQAKQSGRNCVIGGAYAVKQEMVV
jgi:diguanylate cyclase (GGDEF)-like protein